MSQRAKTEFRTSNESFDLPPTPLITRRRILREKYSDLRDEIFPESWSIDVDNWSRKRYCPICKSPLSGSSNCFKHHSEDIHDDWADLIQPWIRWKGLRTRRRTD